MQLIKIIKNYPAIVYIFFAIAFIIRIIPIKYGLPLHLNIDEPSLVSGVISLKHNLNIGRFDWPHLYFYISFLFYIPGYFLSKYQSITLAIGEDGIYFMISRLMSAMFGALTIFPVYSISSYISKNAKVAVLSAIILCFLPVHVYESFFAKLDIPLTFFAAIAVYSIIKCSEELSFKKYALAGFLIGISISIKYNAFLLYLPLVISYIYPLVKSRYSSIKSYTYLPTSGLFSVIGFLIGTPFAIFDFKTFWSTEPRVGVLWQFQNVGNVEWNLYSVNAYNTFFEMYKIDMGITVWITFIILICSYLFFNYRDKYLNILLLPTIILSLYISKLDRSPSHYFLFLIPLYLPVMSRFLVEIYSKIICIVLKDSNLTKKYLVLGLLGFVVVAPSALISIRYSYLYSRVDTRIEAYNWVKNNINEEADFLYVSGESLSQIPFQKNNTTRIKSIDPDQFKEPLPVYLIVGYDGINLDEFRNSGWNPDGVGGSSQRVLSDSALLQYYDNDNRIGPPILIFKISELKLDNE